MSQLVLGWPNGSMGMLFGALAGLLLILQAFRTRPWDIHDDLSWYSEPERWSFGAMLGSFALYAVLLTLILGVGVLDRGVWPPLSVTGDIIGLIILPVTAARLFRRVT